MRWLVLLLSVFVAVPAYGQIQPQPTYAYNKTLDLFTFTQVPGGAPPAGQVVGPFDMAGTGSFTLVQSVAGAGCLANKTITVTVAGASTPTTSWASASLTSYDLQQHVFSYGVVGGSRVSRSSTFAVVDGYVLLDVTTLHPTLGNGCVYTLSAVFQGIPQTQSVIGPVRDSDEVLPTLAAPLQFGVHPILVGGVERTSTPKVVRVANIDSNGGLGVAGSVASGTSLVTYPVSPVIIGGSDGVNARTVRTLTDGTLVVASASKEEYLPAVPTNVTLAASTSGAITGLTASTCYWIVCSADAAFRQGVGTPVAVVTDNFIPARTPMTRCLTSTSTAVAFISSSASTCQMGLITAP